MKVASAWAMESCWSYSFYTKSLLSMTDSKSNQIMSNQIYFLKLKITMFFNLENYEDIQTKEEKELFQMLYNRKFFKISNELE